MRVMVEWFLKMDIKSWIARWDWRAVKPAA
jgi:hypothetical protein